MINPKIISLSLLGILSACGYTDPASNTVRTDQSPNILLIVTDDQRWDELGSVQREQGEQARMPFLETPRLDALASEGIRFRNAFVTMSLCSPSRSSILTGQYNHTNGIIDNDTPFSPRPTWATALQDAGYTTAYFGKWHHGAQWERPGFNHIATFRGQSKYFGTTFKVNGRMVKAEKYVDEQSIDYAIDFLRQSRDRPFAMMIGFKAVHANILPMPEHSQLYEGESISGAPNVYGIAPWRGHMFPKVGGMPRPGDHWRNLARPRAVTGIDNNVGRLLDALDDMNLADNTLVIFTSDNGYHLGEHRLGDKRTAYEESIRIPLIVRLPRREAAGTIADAMVLNIDLAPTILAMANQQVPAAMQGRSMQPLFEDPSAPWRKAFLYEYWQNEHFQRKGVVRKPTVVSVRTDTHKLITYPDYEKWTELFDLRTDPHELRNLAGYKHFLGLRNELCDLLHQTKLETGYIDKPSLNKWLIGITDSLGTVEKHRREPGTSRHPPMLLPKC